MENQLIQKWLLAGKISQEQADMMIADIAAFEKDKSSNSFLSVISILGAIFFGIGILWIVASNWEGMSNFIKIIVLLGSTISITYFGYEIGYNKKNYPKTGHCSFAFRRHVIWCKYLFNCTNL